MAEFYLRPLPGAEALTKFIRVCQEVMPTRAFQSFSVETSLLNPHLQMLNSAPPTWPSSAEAVLKALDERPYCRCLGITATFNTHHSSSLTLAYVVKTDRLAATISISGNNLPGTGLDVLALADSLNREFAFIRPEEIFFGTLPEAQQQQLRVYERAISELTAQVAEMQKISGQMTAENAKYFRERSEEMDRELAKRRSQIQIENDQAGAALKEAESAHETKVKAFELREGTAVRRDLAKRLREDIANNPGRAISGYTRRQRFVVHIICFALLVVFAVCIELEVTRAITTSPAAVTYLPLIGITALFGSTLWFYLRFNYIWADRMAQAELTAQKYDRDFKRADWLTELICEYTKEGKKEFPVEVAARLSHNLFTEVSWGKQNIHPGDDVVEFISRISKFRGGKDGVELDLASESEKKR